MAVIRASADIPAPIDAVFAFVADSTNDPTWCANVFECHQVEGAGPGVGARYRAVHKPGPKASELEIEVLEYEPPSRIRWRQRDEMATFLVANDLEELPGGSTRITQTDETSFNGLFQLLSPVIHLVVRRTIPKQLAALEAHFANQDPER